MKEVPKWTHLKAAMVDLQDLLRCWTCNKVFTEPVSYRCGHFFCGPCAKKSGTKCATCNVPSLASEIRPDRIVTSVAEGFQTLSILLDPGREESVLLVSSDPSKNSSRSPIYENSSSKPSTLDSKENNVGTIKIVEDHVKHARKPSDTYNEELNCKPEVAFVKPNQVKKAPIKENQRASKKKILGSSAHSTTQKSIQEKPSTSFEAKSSLGASDEEFPTDSFVTPKKPRRTSNPSNTISSSIKASSVKSTPRKSNTPGREVVKKNHKGETPLHVACIKGNVERIRSLLAANASPNTKDNAGWTPLHEAANHGFTEVVEMLLAAGALVDVPGAGNVTPLHEAVATNHIGIVKLLVAHGADISARSSEGKTPMDLATTNELREALLNTEITVPLGKTGPNSSQQEMVLCGEPGLTTEEGKELSAVAALLDAREVSVFGPEVTHLIVPSDSSGLCPPSMEILSAILKGVHILSRDWLKFQKDGPMINLDENYFELRGITDYPDAEAPKRSRINAEKQLPGLFNGCHFFVTMNAHYKLQDLNLTRSNIMSLIKTGGGVVLKRQPDPEAIPPGERTVPYHAQRDGLLSSTSHIILYSPGKGEPDMKYNMKHCKTLPVEWFVQCVLHWALMDP